MRIREIYNRETNIADGLMTVENEVVAYNRKQLKEHTTTYLKSKADYVMDTYRDELISLYEASMECIDNKDRLISTMQIYDVYSIGKGDVVLPDSSYRNHYIFTFRLGDVEVIRLAK